MLCNICIQQIASCANTNILKLNGEHLEVRFNEYRLSHLTPSETCIYTSQLPIVMKIAVKLEQIIILYA